MHTVTITTDNPDIVSRMKQALEEFGFDVDDNEVPHHLTLEIYDDNNPDDMPVYATEYAPDNKEEN